MSDFLVHILIAFSSFVPSTTAYQKASSSSASAFADAMAQAKGIESEAYEKAVSKVSGALKHSEQEPFPLTWNSGAI